MINACARFNSRLVPLQNENAVGRIAEIISSEGLSTQGYITIERFSVAEALHPQFRLPAIRRQSENVKSYIVVQPSVCVFSVQQAECLYMSIGDPLCILCSA